MRTNKERIMDLENKIQEYEERNQDYGKRLDALEKEKCSCPTDELQINLNNNNEVLEMLQLQIRNMEKKLEGSLLLENRTSNLELNISNNNKIITHLSEQISKKESQDTELRNLTDDLVKKVLKLSISSEKEEDHGPGKLPGAAVKNGGGTETVEESRSGTTYEEADYFEFENHFRGKRENIKRSQEIYLSRFEKCRNVLDLGCGRGEFLELLKERGIQARGVDLYPEFVEYCRIRGLDVCYGDAVEFLEKCDSADGIFAGQLVEHLDFSSIVKLCRLAYGKLSSGGYLILETPNPTSLAIYTQSFYKDPSHVKPVHPMTLEYVAKKAGFEEVEILYTEASRVPVKIPELNEKIDDTVSEFNRVMGYVSDVLFGSQDYALIAKKL